MLFKKVKGILIMGEFSDWELRAIARERADFKGHLYVYSFVNAILLALNLILTPGQWWFQWATIFWGIGVIGHWYVSYYLDKGAIAEKEYKKLKVLKKRKNK